jgi:hypothetical protein
MARVKILYKDQSLSDKTLQLVALCDLNNNINMRSFALIMNIIILNIKLTRLDILT